ncbi:F510_1955 family glycosylhydrolase [Ornithinimicrobium sufpigmenti]|uniref:F510_1955 family glycosylhydrolase n=1 Tax=Ornithinimicrobium sufpigmenti TaxID=2508882 RepID=UPI001035BA2F|nr:MULTISPECIES: sialidase family protein [unclassified Ornithinimicrobium]
MSARARRTHRGLAAAAGILGLALAGCSPTADKNPTEGDAQEIAITHIHAAVRDPGSGDLLLATHEGLFRQVGIDLVAVGPVMDLMSFAVDADGTYYASGHPGLQTDLPEPLGLLTSADGGMTWTVASRGGESDFHALTTSGSTVVGYDGTLRTSSDRRTWHERSITAPPRALAASPGGTLLATTAAGLLRSTDDGATWDALAPPEPAVLVAWADASTVVALTTGGKVATSTDEGQSWSLGAAVLGEAAALSASRSDDGSLEVIAVVGDSVIRTLDEGVTTEVLVQ